MAELGIEVPAEFTRPARTGVKAVDDGWVDVFHEEPAPGMARKLSPGCEAESQTRLGWFVTGSTTPLYYKSGALTSPPMAIAIFGGPAWLEIKNAVILL
jgi:hypothetical protein